MAAPACSADRKRDLFVRRKETRCRPVARSRCSYSPHSPSGSAPPPPLHTPALRRRRRCRLASRASRHPFPRPRAFRSSSTGPISRPRTPRSARRSARASRRSAVSPSRSQPGHCRRSPASRESLTSNAILSSMRRAPSSRPRARSRRAIPSSTARHGPGRPGSTAAASASQSSTAV